MGLIDNVDFFQLEAEKYWSFPKSYKGDKKTETRNMIFSGEYLGSRKMDGAYYRFIKDMDGNMSLQGRSRSVSGDFLNKVGHVPHLQEFFAKLPAGTCLLGELYFPDDEGSNRVTTIMGCKEDKAIQRQSTGKQLHYYIFDVWAFDGKSYMNMIAEDRFQKIYQLSTEYKDKSVDWAIYVHDENLWELLQITLAEGGEGIVITKANSVPAPGKRTARKTLKIKKEISETLDVLIVGANPPAEDYGGKEIETWEYWQNIVTKEFIKDKLWRDYNEGAAIKPVTKSFFNNWAGSLKIGVYKDDKIVQIGSLSGLDKEILKNWRDYTGKVAEVSCMEVYKETLGLRHPKFIQWRPDKNPEECTWETIYENENL